MPLWGLDTLGLAGFESRLVAREIPDRWCVGSFGTRVFPVVKGVLRPDPIREVRLALLTGRVPLFRLQALWEDDHNFTQREHLSLLKDELTKWKPLFTEFNNRVAMCVSPLCEHNLSDRELSPFLDVCRSVLPTAHVVSSPNKNVRISSIAGVINEIHGTGRKDPGGRYFFSYDGDPCVDADVEADKRAHARAEVFFWWISQFNGKRKKDDDTKRQDRTKFPRGNLGSKYIDSVIYLTRSKGATKLPKNYLWKSHGDQPEKGDDRAGEVVLIAPGSVSEMTIRASNGQIVAKASRGDVYKHDTGSLKGRRNLYRFGEFGFILAEKAVRIQKSPLCELWAGSKKIGVVNPAFRDPDFRGEED